MCRLGGLYQILRPAVTGELTANSRVTMVPLSGTVARDDAGEVASRVSTRRTSAAEKFGRHPEHRELSINF